MTTYQSSSVVKVVVILEKIKPPALVALHARTKWAFANLYIHELLQDLTDVLMAWFFLYMGKRCREWLRERGEAREHSELAILFSPPSPSIRPRVYSLQD